MMSSPSRYGYQTPRCQLSVCSEQSATWETTSEAKGLFPPRIQLVREIAQMIQLSRMGRSLSNLIISRVLCLSGAYRVAIRDRNQYQTPGSHLFIVVAQGEGQEGEGSICLHHSSPATEQGKQGNGQDFSLAEPIPKSLPEPVP